MAKKRCSKCGLEKKLSDFHKDASRKDGMYAYCKECNQKAIVNYVREKRTGFNADDYTKMFSEQKGCCAICGKHQSELKRALSADHCHSTGTKRGLLCFKCNMGLGYYNDDVNLLKSAINYLEK